MPLSYLTFLLAIALVVPRPLLADGELPASLIRIPESVSTLFVAETSTAKFHRFDRSNDLLTYSGSFFMSIGKEGAGKNRSGDKRTPFGAYFVTEQLDTTKLHAKYGVTAFPLDYPNAWDLRAGRDGDGIWVHGVDPRGGKRPKRDTDGCIALPNEDLSNLAAPVRSKHHAGTGYPGSELDGSDTQRGAANGARRAGFEVGGKQSAGRLARVLVVLRRAI